MNLSENSSNHSIRPDSNGYPTCRLCTPLLELVHHEVGYSWNGMFIPAYNKYSQYLLIQVFLNIKRQYF